ncbi:MAG: helix-turn-helix domain-containing protein [Beutenbergiaceae bacterium]
MDANLGSALRKERQQRGLSLRSVAAATGISPSLLSQVETGKTQPSVDTLYALVNHLDVSVDEIMGTGRVREPIPNTQLTLLSRNAPDSPSDSVVQRAEDNPLIELESGVRWERLAVGPFHGVDPLVITYEPHNATSEEHLVYHRHTGIEYGYVMHGELVVKLEFETYRLRAGDSICFDSDRPHVMLNETDEITKSIWFVTGRNGAKPPSGPQVHSGDGLVAGTAAAFEAIDSLGQHSDDRSD